MNRNDFMKQLESLLQNVPPAEREEALQYYNDYFDDAGAENEKEVIEALGNPARVAENIKRDLTENSEAVRVRASDHALMEYGKDITGTQNQELSAKAKEKKTDLPTWAIVLLVILLILASPAILSAGAAVFGVALSLAVTWFALILAFGCVALTLFFTMFVLLIIGIMCFPTDFVVSLGLIGGAMLCGSIGILFMMLTVAIGGIATPAILKGIVNLVRKKPAEGKENGVA